MNNSILDKIINSKKSQELADLNAVEIIDNIFSELSPRERDILIKRYGLHSEKRETLETIGNHHKLTRERIRQIETYSVKKLRELKKIDEYLSLLKKVIIQLLEEHGGAMEEQYLLDILIDYSLQSSGSKSKNELIHKNYLNFLITQLLYDDFEKVNNSEHFKSYYKLKFKKVEHLEELIVELYEKLKEINKLHNTEEIIDLFLQTEAYLKHKEKINTNGVVDISGILNFDFFEENHQKINENKVFYSLLRLSKKIEQNKFGYWGIHNWKTVKPSTINDKIYLVMQYKKKSMHFVEIADLINEIGFDKKKANPATVHNELILDDKYVLIGRGLYSLAEWGYKKGTVADVIENIMQEAGEPLDKNEVIEAVLKQRDVKKSTVVLALLNRDRFKKIGDKYFLK